jgi:hypothetical protein
MENTNPKKRSFLKKFVLIFLLVVILGITLMFLAFNISVSNGATAGTLMKISKTGIMFRTYEGELNTGGMNTVPGTAQVNQIWNFSVKDPAVADSLMHLGGRKVSLHYHEVVKALPWQGETNFFVDGVDVLNP